ncbi:MAG: hypothetical protein ACKVS6_02780 [Planctomycetota bacterium]
MTSPVLADTPRTGRSRSPWIVAFLFVAIDALFILWYIGGSEVNNYAAEESAFDSVYSDSVYSEGSNSESQRAARAQRIVDSASRGTAQARRPARSAPSAITTKTLALTARFRTASGAPASNINIDVLQWKSILGPSAAHNPKIATLTTDGEGRVVGRTLQIEPHGPVQFISKEHGIAGFWPSELPLVDDTLHVDAIDLAQPLAIRGRVVYDTGGPVQSGIVNVFSASAGYGSAKLDDAGKFTIQTLPEGDISLWIVDAESTPAEELFAVDARTADEELEFTLRRGRAVQGKVHKSGGTPVYPARICCVSERGTMVTGVTRRDGRFFIRGLPPNEPVDVQIFDLKNCYIGGKRSVSAHEKSVSIEIPAQPPSGRVTVRILDEETNLPLYWPSTVRLYRRRESENIVQWDLPRRETTEESDEWSPRTFLSDATKTEDGALTFDYGKLGPGKFFVSVDAAGYFYRESEPFVATGAEDAGTIEMRLQKPCRVEGRILDRDSGKPTNVARIALATPENKSNREKWIYCKNRVGHDGKYQFEGLRPGTYDVFPVTFYNSNNEAPAGRVTLRSGEKLVDFDIYITQAAKKK